MVRMLLKKHLPHRVIKVSKLAFYEIDKLTSRALSQSFFLSNLFYAVSRKFTREHRAVLAGKSRYHQYNRNLGNSSALMRRNTHRLEKGLIMRPRRTVFAESYIADTVDIFARSINVVGFDIGEQKWAHDVLEKYFSCVDDTPIIALARSTFEECTLKFEAVEKFIPYQWSAMPNSEVSYAQLENLFARRRSVRWYQDKLVSRELIYKSVRLAATAPSACNRQPYQFYICDSKDRVVEIAKCAGGTPGWATGIPCIAVIVGDLSCYASEQDRHAIYVDGSLAAMQLMLAFETLGISSCPINWPDIDRAEKKLSKILGLEVYERPVMLLSFGYALVEGGIPYSLKKTPESLTKFV
jgi:nitroreductase